MPHVERRKKLSSINQAVGRVTSQIVTGRGLTEADKKKIRAGVKKSGRRLKANFTGGSFKTIKRKK